MKHSNKQSAKEIALHKNPGMPGIMLSTVWFLFCLAVFLQRQAGPFLAKGLPPLPSPALITEFFLVRTAGQTLRVVLFWAAVWRLGRWSMSLLRMVQSSSSEEFLLSLGFGAGILGSAAFGLGVCGMLHARLLEIILCGLAATTAPALYRLFQNRKAATCFSRIVAAIRGNYVPTALLAVLILYQFLIALEPTTFFDGLVYHLALPAVYLRRGAIMATPLNAYAGIPAGVEMLYVWMLALGGQGSACQVLNLSLGVLSVAAIAVAGRRLGSTAAGLWGALIFFSNPMVMILSGRPGIELGWSFFLALTLLGSLIYLDSGDGRWLAPVGILAGLTLGTKYQAIMLLPALVVLLVRRDDSKAGLSAWLKVCLVAVVVAAPWGLRNIAFYRNPVFPFLGGSVFPPNAIDMPAFMSSAHSRSLSSIIGTWEGFKEFVVHPWSYSFPYPNSASDGVLSFAYLAALPLFFIKPFALSGRRLLLFAAVLWIPINIMSGLPRFSIPALVPLSLALGMAMVAQPERIFGFARIAAVLIVTLSGLYVHAASYPQWRVLSGEVPESALLGHAQPAYPAPAYGSFAWANAHLPADAKVLLIGEPRSFYLERDVVTSSPYASQPIAEFANAASSGDDLYRRLRNAGVTHLIVNFQWMGGSSHQTMRMSASGLEALRSFWADSMIELYAEQNKDPSDARSSAVYRLLTPEERDRPHSLMEVPFSGQPAKLRK